MPFIPTMFIALAGATAGVIVIWPVVYVLRDQVEEPGGIATWLAFGGVFAVALPIVTGAFLPMAIVWIDLVLGNAGVSELPALIVGAMIAALWSSIIGGATSLYTALLAAPVFSVGAWMIDRLNASRDPFVSKYAVWILVLSLGTVAVGIAAFAPPEILKNLG